MDNKLYHRDYGKDKHDGEYQAGDDVHIDIAVLKVTLAIFVTLNTKKCRQCAEYYLPETWFFLIIRFIYVSFFLCLVLSLLY